jgi:hypothetical protein
MAQMPQFRIEWLGSEETDLFQDILSKDTNSAGLASNMVFTKKTTTLAEQIGMIGAAAALTSTIDQHPALAAFIGVVVLAAISPVSLEILPDAEGDLLGVLTKLATGCVIDQPRLRALLMIEPSAELCIDVLCEKGFLRKSEKDGNQILRIQRPVLKNIKISFL